MTPPRYTPRECASHFRATALFLTGVGLCAVAWAWFVDRVAAQ